MNSNLAVTLQPGMAFSLNEIAEHAKRLEMSYEAIFNMVIAGFKNVGAQISHMCRSWECATHLIWNEQTNVVSPTVQAGRITQAPQLNLIDLLFHGSPKWARQVRQSTDSGDFFWSDGHERICFLSSPEDEYTIANVIARSEMLLAKAAPVGLRLVR